MDFISKVSAKAEETIQTIKDSEITQKAKNYAEIPGLQVQIGKCENNIRKAYEEIGRLYFNAYTDDPEELYKDLFETVKENQAKIGQLKADIEEKKNKDNIVDPEPKAEAGEKVCPICGRSMEADAVFCSVCGHQF